MNAKGSQQDTSIAPSVCGVVMPISAMDNCSEAHWSEVLNIVSDAIGDAGLKPNLVSNADEVGIIQKRIIQNLYDNPIVVCDVSGKNPNVMFELGLRLAFDKPTIIIKDDKTDYSFDTSPIEHIPYPRDLRFSQIINFKRDLTSKIKATLERSQSDKSYTTFLKHFGEFTVVEIGKKEVSQQEFLSEELSDIRRYLRSIESGIRRGGSPRFGSIQKRSICLEGLSENQAREILRIAEMRPEVRSVSLESVGDHFHLYPNFSPSSEQSAERSRRSLASMIADFRNKNI